MGMLGRWRARRRPPTILIIVENAALERDTRVQREATALVRAGYGVTVICPRGKDAPVFQVAGLAVRRFPLPEGSGRWSFIVEYAWALLAISFLAALELTRSQVRAVQICNPPDLLFLATFVFRALRIPVVLDHHDPTPEMYESRFGRRDRLHGLLLRLERATFSWVDHVFTTNASLADIARRRGGVPSARITVVRNAPAITVRQAEEMARRLDAGRSGRRIVWAGDMGPHDGVIELLEAFEMCVLRGIDDVQLVLVGDGEVRAAAKARSHTAALQGCVRFTGWLSQEALFSELAAADVAVVPDPPTPRAEISTMIKVMEYMVFGLPIVAHDLVETRRSAGEAALYVDGSVGDLANGIMCVLDDPVLAERMGRRGQARMEGELSWETQESMYVDQIGKLL